MLETHFFRKLVPNGCGSKRCILPLVTDGRSTNMTRFVSHRCSLISPLPQVTFTTLNDGKEVMTLHGARETWSKVTTQV